MLSATPSVNQVRDNTLVEKHDNSDPSSLSASSILLRGGIKNSNCFPRIPRLTIEIKRPSNTILEDTVKSREMNQLAPEDIKDRFDKALESLINSKQKLEEHITTQEVGPTITAIRNKLHSINTIIREAAKQREAFKSALKSNESKASEKNNQTLLSSIYREIIIPLEAQAQAMKA